MHKEKDGISLCSYFWVGKRDRSSGSSGSNFFSLNFFFVSEIQFRKGHRFRLLFKLHPLFRGECLLSNRCRSNLLMIGRVASDQPYGLQSQAPFQSKYTLRILLPIFPKEGGS